MLDNFIVNFLSYSFRMSLRKHNLALIFGITKQIYTLFFLKLTKVGSKGCRDYFILNLLLSINL